MEESKKVRVFRGESTNLSQHLTSNNYVTLAGRFQAISLVIEFRKSVPRHEIVVKS